MRVPWLSVIFFFPMGLHSLTLDYKLLCGNQGNISPFYPLSP